MKLITTTLSGLILAAASLIPCHASTIKLGIAGDAEVNYSAIDFFTGSHFANPPHFGDFDVEQVSNGMLRDAGVTRGQSGLIQSLTLTNAVASLDESKPFISLENGTLDFYATSFPSGATLGSFTLTQGKTGVVGSMDVDGYFIDTLTGVMQSYDGVFSATFAGLTIDQLTSSLPIFTPYSGTFTVDPTPEPASLLLLGSGLVAVGFISRRKMLKA